MQSRTLLTILGALALAAPGAGAAWSAHGAFEPDYPADVTERYMFADPDKDPNPAHRQVYFNVVMGYNTLGVNPNAGALESRILAPGFQAPTAFLGVWKECNEDGYIGMAESAITEYRAELLSSNDMCPLDTTHNRGGWVYEFLWIGPGDNTLVEGTATPRSIDDREAAVWGDPGLPGAAPEGSTCFINPSEGTFSGTGGLLAYADCNGGNAVAQAVTDADPTGELGFGDDVATPQCSDSLLNVRRNVFHDDPKCPTGETPLLGGGASNEAYEDDAAFTVWDCSSEQRVAVGTPAIPDVAEPVEVVAYVPAGAAPDARNPTGGSYYEAADQAVGTPLGGCGTPAQTGADGLYFAIEAPVKQSNVKRETTFWFQYMHEIFPTVGLARALTGDETPSYGGLGYFNSVQLMGPGWHSAIAVTDAPPLAETRGDGAGPRYYSFYARLGPSTLASVVIPGAGGTYGAEWCGTSTGVNEELGVDCDAANWWDTSKGASEMPRDVFRPERELGQVVGATYHLRDVDCYDGTITSAAPGVGLGLTLLDTDEGGGPCSNFVPQ